MFTHVRTKQPAIIQTIRRNEKTTHMTTPLSNITTIITYIYKLKTMKPNILGQHYHKDVISENNFKKQ